MEVFARMTKNRAIGQNAFHIFSSGKLNFHGPKQLFNQYGIPIEKLVFLVLVLVNMYTRSVMTLYNQLNFRT